MTCPFCSKKIPKLKLLSHLDEHLDRAYEKESYYYNLGEKILKEYQNLSKRK